MRPRVASLALTEDSAYRDASVYKLAECPYLAVVRFDGTLFFANASFLEDQITERMASIGRLAAGVAHEINNPLAIINEKAGLIKDLIVYGQAAQATPERLTGLVDSILGSVTRAGTITKRLLSFARQLEVSIAPVALGKVLEEVLGFLTKEAEYRGITVDVQVADDLPLFESDRGKLQQIFLNLVNNAFQAMMRSTSSRMASSSLRSVMSSLTATKWLIVPASSRMGEMEASSQ